MANTPLATARPYRFGETLAPAAQKMDLLLVEDDATAREAISNYLQRHDIRVHSSSRRQEARQRLASCNPELMILGLGRNRQDGLDLLREIRSCSDVPIILTTDEPSDEFDRVAGLELGADDCVTKPFGLRELLARIHAVLRREAGRRRDARGRCRFGGWELDRRARRLSDPNGCVVALTKGEYALLDAFVEAPQRPLSREQLLRATRMYEDLFDRSIDVQVLRLRRKLEGNPRSPRLIQTERGFGYVLAVPVEHS
ncbi:MAG: response regulator transcription factor [Rhizomicrobium sp.]